MLTPNASCTLYLQERPGAVYRRIFCPAVFWQEDAESTTIIIPKDLPEQYKGQKREHDYVIKGSCACEVTNTEELRALLLTAPLTIKSLSSCMFGGLAHCEVTAN